MTGSCCERHVDQYGNRRRPKITIDTVLESGGCEIRIFSGGFFQSRSFHDVGRADGSNGLLRPAYKLIMHQSASIFDIHFTMLAPVIVVYKGPHPAMLKSHVSLGNVLTENSRSVLCLNCNPLSSKTQKLRFFSFFETKYFPRNAIDIRREY